MENNKKWFLLSDEHPNVQMTHVFYPEMAYFQKVSCYMDKRDMVVV
jgi:hypothetical protein